MRYETKRALRGLVDETIGSVCKLILLICVGGFFGFGATLGFFFALQFAQALL